MIVVSDASPIMNLAAIGQLHLLPKMFGEVLVPEAVAREILALGAGQPGTEIFDAESFVVRAVQNRNLIKSKEWELDAGESEAIALSLECRAELTLIDERLGRSVAVQLGIKTIGVLGVLIRAKERGHIDKIGPLLAALKQFGFFISGKLVKEILRIANETN